MTGKLLKKKKTTTTTETSLKTRTVAFNKRKQCLKKKTFELSTLCDIDACFICVGPNGEIDIWPPEKHKLEAIINRYRSSGINVTSKSSYLKNPCFDEMLDELSEEELRDLREELLKKKKNGGKKKQSKISKEEEESEKQSLVPNSSDVLPACNTVETLDDDDEFNQELYFDPTVLEETLSSSSSDWDWDLNHQPEIIIGSGSTEIIYDDPSSMKFDDYNGMMTIEEQQSVCGYETMNDIILMCQMGSEEQSQSLLPMFDYNLSFDVPDGFGSDPVEDPNFLKWVFW